MMRSVFAAVGALAIGLVFERRDGRGPAIVKGPGVEPACFAPWGDVKYFQWPKKEGPYKIAVVNGFVANVWRIQMIKTAKAYAAVPDIAKDLKEFKVVLVGTDMAAQLGAVEDYINQGFDAVLIDPNTPTGWDRVVRLANQKGTILIAYDNQVDTKDMAGSRRTRSRWARRAASGSSRTSATRASILEIRGVPGFSADKERHDGLRSVLEAAGNNFEIVEVVGNWAPGNSQKATADAIAAHGHFDGIFTQGGSNGTVQALIDAHHPFVPMAGEGENLYRIQIAEYAKDGLKGMSYGQSPAQVAIALKEAIAALKGGAIPQLVSIPNPIVDYTNMKAGVDYFPDLKADFSPPTLSRPAGWRSPRRS